MLRKLTVWIAICLFLNTHCLWAVTTCESSAFLHEHQDDKLDTVSCPIEPNKIETISSGKAQRTFCMVKPDGVQRNLIGEIIKRYEAKGLKLVALKFNWPKEGVVREFYRNSADEPFFEYMIKYVQRGPVVAMVWEGYNAVTIGRQLLTGGNRLNPAPGSIRGDFSSNDLIHRFTVAHGSDSVEEAEREMLLWFTAEELISWDYSNEIWIYQE